MTNEVSDMPSSLPSRKWSIVALGSAGMMLVVLSFVLALVVAAGCLALPYVFFWLVRSNGFLIGRILLSLFGLVAGVTILLSLLPKRNKVKVNGVLLDLSKETRLAKEIEGIAAALREPVPVDVYVVADANAFVMETGGFLGFGSRRVMGLGLPLMQMLTVAQFRAILAHEFAHYYSGDTRLGPWLYSTRTVMGRVYQNLGNRSEMMKILTRWVVVAVPYMGLMAGMRMYWKMFMRITQAISRRQEFRSDELACHVAGSEALIGGLENIRKCQAGLGAYWNSVVLPVAAGGYQPQLADGFLRFMSAPHIAKATAEYLAKQSEVTEASAMDTHPPLSRRVERAQRLNVAVRWAGDGEQDLPSISLPSISLPSISLIDQLDLLERDLLKTQVPGLAKVELKPMSWEGAGTAVYVPIWRRQVERFVPALLGKTMKDLPGLVKGPGLVSDLVPTPQGEMPNREKRDGKAMDILAAAVALCVVDNGWTPRTEPGTMYLERGADKLEPGRLIGTMRAGKFSAEQWSAYCDERGMGDWMLVAAPILVESA